MRTLNVRLAGILLAVTVVFGIGVYFLHASQVRSNASFFREESARAEEEAAQAAKEKNFEAEEEARKNAIRYLDWYVRLMPDEYEAMERLGMMMAARAMDGDAIKSRQMFLQAYGRLEATVRLAPDRKVARRQLVKMAMLARRHQEAKDHLEKLRDDDPKNPELLDLLGQCQAGMGNYDTAAETFKKTIANGSNQLMAYLRLAELLRYRLSRPQDADRWMEKLVSVNPKASQAHVLRGRYLLAINEIDEALEEASQGLKLAPDDADALVLAATCNLAKGKIDEARDCAARGIKLFPSSVDMYKTMADIELRAQKRDKALAVLEQGIKATGRDPQLQWSLANLLIDANRLEESKKIIAVLQDVGYPKAPLDYLLARIEFVQGHWFAAKQQFEAVRGSLIQQPERVRQVDLWTAQCYAQLGNRDKQLQALRRAVNVDQNFAPAKAALMDALMQTGRIDEALEIFADLDKRRQLGPASYLPLARMLFARTIRQNPAERDWGPLEKALDSAEKAMPDSHEVPLLRADMFLNQNRADDAEKLLLQTRDRFPKENSIGRALISLAEHQKDWKKAERLLAESETKHGDTVEQRLAEAQNLVRQQGKKAVNDLRKLADDADKFPETARLQLWAGLLSAASQVGDSEQAMLLSEKIRDKQPNNAQIRYLIFEQALAAEDIPGMEKALKDIEIVASHGSYWLYGRAVLLFLGAKGKDRNEAAPALKEALELLAKAREARKDWSRIPLVEAGVYDQQGRPDMAMKCYLEAMDMGERNPNAIRRMIQLLFQTRQYAEAVRRIELLEKERSELSPELIRALAEGELQLGDSSGALEKARKAVAADSKDFQQHLWLGQILGILGNQAKAKENAKEAKDLFADAENSLRRAAELEPKLPVVWVSLVRFLVAVGEDEKAKAEISNAEKNIPAKDALMALAQCYEVVKQADAALEKYEAALAASPKDVSVAMTVADFYRRTGKLLQADALLHKILDGKIEANESELVVARRLLAQICAARGDYKNLQQAQELIEKNLASIYASPFDRRFYATLKASDPQVVERVKAMEMWKKLVEDQLATPDDALSLAKMYLAAGNWSEASALLRNLVTTYDKDPRFLVIYLDALLQHEETSNVEAYFDRLEKLAPNWFETTSLRADILCAPNKNKPLEAIEVLKNFVDKTDVLPHDRAARLRLVADKLDRLGRQLTKPEQAAVAEKFAGQAELLYRTFVKENAGQDLVLAVYLGSNGKADEALDILERILPSSAPQTFAQVCSLILQAGKANKEQLQRMNQIMLVAIKKFDRPTTLLLVMAELRTRQLQYAEAAEFYREVLKKSPTNAVAMNNLGVLQAMQGIELEESLKLVDHAIEIAGPLGPMLDSRATVYIAMNEPDKALDDLKLALIDRETPVRLFHQAQAHALAGQKATAQAALDKALKKGLTKEMLQPLELPTFEKLKRLQR